MNSIVLDELFTANRILDIIAVFFITCAIVPTLTNGANTRLVRVMAVFIALLFCVALISNCAGSEPAPTPVTKPVEKSLQEKFETLQLAGPVRNSQDRCRMMTDIACTWIANCAAKPDTETHTERYQSCMVLNFPGCGLIEGITETEAELCGISMLETPCNEVFPPWQCRGIAEAASVGPIPQQL